MKMMDEGGLEAEVGARSPEAGVDHDVDDLDLDPGGHDQGHDMVERSLGGQDPDQGQSAQGGPGRVPDPAVTGAVQGVDLDTASPVGSPVQGQGPNQKVAVQAWRMDLRSRPLIILPLKIISCLITVGETC